MSIIKDKARGLGFRQITGGKSKFIPKNGPESQTGVENPRRLRTKVVGNDFAMFTGEDFVTMAVRLTDNNRPEIEAFFKKTLGSWKTLGNCPYDGGRLFDAEGEELLSVEELREVMRSQ